MRILLLCCLFGFFAVCGAAPVFEWSVTVPPQGIGPSPVFNVTVKNTSDESKKIYLGYCQCGIFRFSVRTSGGDVVARGEPILGQEGIHAALKPESFKLNPGQSAEFELCLANWDITLAPGQYVLEVAIATWEGIPIDPNDETRGSEINVREERTFAVPFEVVSQEELNRRIAALPPPPPPPAPESFVDHDRDYYEQADEFEATMNYPAAAWCLEQVAAQEDSPHRIDAAARLGDYYFISRKGIPPDENKAREYDDMVIAALLETAVNGAPEAQYRIASIWLRRNPRFPEGCDLMEKAAQQGHVAAQAQMALIYFGDFYRVPDDAKIKEWAEKAIAGNSMAAKAYLGAWYIGEDAKSPVGLALLQEAADAGCPAGLHFLGTYYVSGRSGEWLFDKGFPLIEEAAYRGFPRAVRRMTKDGRRMIWDGRTLVPAEW